MWLDEDTAAALAYIDYIAADQSERCPRCGTKHSDWVDENGRDLRAPKWEARIIDCEGCRVLDEGNADLAGIEDRTGKRVALGRYNPDTAEAEDRVHPGDDY